MAKWREGTDQPYLIKAALETLQLETKRGWKLLPLHLTSGGGDPTGWIIVPETIHSFEEVLNVVKQVPPLELTYDLAKHLGLSKVQVDSLRTDLFAYLLGIMVGDSGKHGGEQPRYASMHLDLQLTTKRPTNQRLGEFVIMCANSWDSK